MFMTHNGMHTVKKVNVYNCFNYFKVIFFCINVEINTHFIIRNV
jgi:hypothetical protein